MYISHIQFIEICGKQTAKHEKIDVNYSGKQIFRTDELHAPPKYHYRQESGGYFQTIFNFEMGFSHDTSYCDRNWRYGTADAYKIFGMAHVNLKMQPSGAYKCKGVTG